MRILILTHARSGGKSILNWVTKEKGYHGYHEPNIKDGNLFLKILKEDNIVVKLFPAILDEHKVNLGEFIKLFDKVICHHRENMDDVAVSMVYGNERDNKNHNNWHETYDVTDDWLCQNKDKIEEKLKEVNEIIDRSMSLNINCLKTTYDGIFENKKDITKLIEFLEIKQPFYLDILDKRHRLRGGVVGEGDFRLFKSIL